MGEFSPLYRLPLPKSREGCMVRETLNPMAKRHYSYSVLFLISYEHHLFKKNRYAHTVFPFASLADFESELLAKLIETYIEKELKPMYPQSIITAISHSAFVKTATEIK